MNRMKRIILAIIAVLVLVMAVVLVYVINFSGQNTTNRSEEGKTTSKVADLYYKLIEKQEFRFIMTIDKQNKMDYAKKGKMAYIDTVYQGNETTYIIKDGNTHLLYDNQKTYYTYQNNETELNKITLQLEKLKNQEPVIGKEKIQNKQYTYEEYEGYHDFSLKNVDNQQNVKTRFYFDNSTLVYIKTIISEEQELASINLSYRVEEKLFDIPNDFKNGDE